MDDPHGRVGKKLVRNCARMQILEARSHETTVVRSSNSHFKNHPNKTSLKDSWKSKDELISHILQWTPSHRRARVGLPTRTYLQQFCIDTQYNLEELPEVMDDRDEWWERVREIRASNVTKWIGPQIISNLIFRFFYLFSSHILLLHMFWSFSKLPDEDRNIIKRDHTFLLFSLELKNLFL